MLVGIPGRVVERVEGLGDQLALVTVAGVPRGTHAGPLDDETFDEGRWVIIHMGVALDVVDETAADRADEEREPTTGGDPDSPEGGDRPQDPDYPHGPGRRAD